MPAPMRSNGSAPGTHRGNIAHVRIRVNAVQPSTIGGMVLNLRVRRFSDASELRYCTSELEVPAAGWALVEREGPFHAGERDLFFNGEFIGVTESVEIAPSFTEVMYAPIPPED